MLGSLTLNMIWRKIHCADVVTEDQCRLVNRTMQFQQEFLNQTCFSHSVCNAAILGLSAGTRQSLLVRWGPRYQVFTKINTIARCQSLGLRTSSPIGIWISYQLVLLGFEHFKTMRFSSLNEPYYLFQSIQVELSRIMHKKVYLLKRICDIRTSKCQILKSPRKNYILRLIINFITCFRKRLWVKHQSRTRYFFSLMEDKDTTYR